MEYPDRVRAANQQVPLNVMVPLSWLQGQLAREGRANLFLVGAHPGQGGTPALEQAVRAAWQLEDSEADLVASASDTGLELRSSRVFLRFAKPIFDECSITPDGLLRFVLLI